MHSKAIAIADSKLIPKPGETKKGEFDVFVRKMANPGHREDELTLEELRRNSKMAASSVDSLHFRPIC
jgi:hypothetical protein